MFYFKPDKPQRRALVNAFRLELQKTPIYNLVGGHLIELLVFSVGHIPML